MDLLTIIGAILSRWFVVIPILALTGYGAYLAAEQAQIEYTAAGSVLLVDPGGSDGEPAAESEASEADVTLSGSIIADIVEGDPVRLSLAERGANAPYTVEAEGDGRILRVTSTADAPEGIVETVSAVLEQIGASVQERQSAAGVAPDGQTTVETIVEPVEATPLTVRDQVTGSVVTRWSAFGVALLVDPPPPAAQPTNPLGASRYLANILEQEISDGQLRETILEPGTILEYRVAEDRTDAAPILYLSVTGTQPGDVMRTYDRLIDIVETRLAERQESEGAPPDTWIGLRPLSTPVAPEADTSGAMRPALTIVAVGVLAAASLAVLVDGLIASRRRSRRVAKAQEPEWVPNGSRSDRGAPGRKSLTVGPVIRLPEPPERLVSSRSGSRAARHRHRSET